MTKNIILILCLAIAVFTRTTQAAEYTLAVQPVLPPDKLEEIYKPLADYLSKETGQTIKLKTFRTFKSYWYSMKRLNGFDMVLDAAHFTDYRIKKNNYRVLVKVPETVSFTVVTKSDLFVFDVDELASYRIASMVAPGVGGLRLKEMFIDANQSPTLISAYDSDNCIKLIREGKADAAIIPTPMVGRYDDLNTVVTTTPIPHVAFSVSPDISETVARLVKTALIDASNTDRGRKMLAAINFDSFEPATNQIYDGYADLLKIMKKRGKK